MGLSGAVSRTDTAAAAAVRAFSGRGQALGSRQLDVSPNGGMISSECYFVMFGALKCQSCWGLVEPSLERGVLCLALCVSYSTQPAELPQ